MSSALIVVDVQKDFCEGGALPVPGGNRVAHNIALYIEHLGDFYQEIVFTVDAHLEWPDTNGGHFSETPDYKDSWPPHCQVGTNGFYFHTDIRNTITTIPLTRLGWNYAENTFLKGTGSPDYSGFQGRNKNDVVLHDYLKGKGIKNVDVVGLAADFCVKETAIDAKLRGYTANILPTLTAAVHKDGLQNALQDLDATEVVW